MFGRKKKINKNYYISPFNEEYLSRSAKKASVLAILAVIPFIPALILWIYPGIGATVWLYESYEAQIAYVLLFFCALIGSIFCAVMSFFFFKIRKKVMEKDAPTLGFRRSSYNGIFFTAVLTSALLIYHIVMVIGYSVSLNSGYIAEIIAKHALKATAALDAVTFIELALFIIAAALSWTYYVYTYRVNRSMQLVIPDSPTPERDELSVPSAEEAKKHRPKRSDDYEPPKSMFCLTEEEKELGKREFVGYEEESEDLSEDVDKNSKKAQNIGTKEELKSEDNSESGSDINSEDEESKNDKDNKVNKDNK